MKKLRQQRALRQQTNVDEIRFYAKNKKTAPLKFNRETDEHQYKLIN